ncbi:acetyl-CoA carboxyl transferase [Lactobacillus pentosus]|uniref:Acetyl-coenzyme A carboxylase carboxyl transferase subunit beta n=1 Tax=Lactiplantibacillus pentosus TaxID=1589 RepID=A0AB37RLS9_LACPE|nr:acetyl-CoA carboxylase carboxyltransferase subunit beta [Lactiplantibacillus pentosus]BBM21102.1 acetyl-coenzyme A carboxylase carboxyl transferase subunit beta 1 [Lactiplantibacillus plantarum]MCT3293672.1 acetyl-CoA carboxyl transferase [Lactiplantibacillus pentosus]MPQ20103.1 acetyl-CoA carboxyl transferase [Lactiplantibacillus pentosus]RMW44354.1 acetyl-CoA carboxyl transferase [Lactiplantibacillus pentosus]RMW44437.1 acetyl-CoA carboxyl transferase [Lactiplantibacillus pentosus]
MSHYPSPGTWSACPNCGRHVHQRQWGTDQQCPYCHYWRRLTATQRIQQLTDAETFQPFEMPERTVDRLAFPDYPAKLQHAEQETGLSEAIICGTAQIAQQSCVLAVMDSHFMMGTLNTAVTRRLLYASEQARARQLPLVIVTASGGARMQEGIYALVGMNLILAELARLAQDQLPLITVLTDPTMGGVSASFAFEGDLVLAEAGAKIGFAGARVIQQTTPADLPADFQTADQLFENGMLDAVVERPHLKAYLGRTLANYGIGGRADG